MVLEISKIIKSLSALEGWSFDTFDEYMDGIQFINEIAILAEEKKHHPDIKIGYCKVQVGFTSHDHGGVTEKCIDMAKKLEAINQ
jgi:4a-hydroxytetrahydrobiopterin dehydratase